MIPKSAFANIAQSTTDGNIVNAVTGRPLRVTSFILSPGATATSVTFNSKPAGAGVAISAAFTVGANTPFVAPHNPDGYFDTNAGEGLTATTGAGSTVGIQVKYNTIQGKGGF